MKKTYIIFIVATTLLIILLLALFNQNSHLKNENEDLKAIVMDQEKQIMVLEKSLKSLDAKTVPEVIRSEAEVIEKTDSQTSDNWLITFEKDLSQVKTMEDLVTLHRGNLDGAASEGYAGAVYSLYESLGTEAFIDELSMYGDWYNRQDIALYVTMEQSMCHYNGLDMHLDKERHVLLSYIEKDSTGSSEKALAYQLLSGIEMMLYSTEE